MKKILLIVTCLFLGVYANAQTKLSDWEALKMFHIEMSKVYSPNEKVDLALIKLQSAKLYQRAKELKKSTVPALFKSKELKNKLKDLEERCKNLNDMITNKKGNDDQISTLVKSSYELFNSIVEQCRKDTLKEAKENANKK